MNKAILAVIVLVVGLASDSLNIIDKANSFYKKQNTTKEIEIKKMFYYTNMEKMLNSMSQQMTMNMIINNPSLKNNKEFNDYAKNIASTKKIEDMYIKIYSQHYTLAELVKINEYYSTDEMQKFFTLSPQVARDLANEMSKMFIKEANSFSR